MRTLRATPLGLLALVTLAGVVVLAGADRATASSFSSTSRSALPDSSTGVSAAASATGFLETFDGEAPTPVSGSFYNNPNWDVFIGSRFDKETVMDMPFAQMGPNCEPPPATHFNNSYLGVVFICRNHLMTAVTTGGYAQIQLTPNHLVDFSQGEAVIRFDRSGLSTSSRDWTDFWITPFEDNLMAPLETW